MKDNITQNLDFGQMLDQHIVQPIKKNFTNNENRLNAINVQYQDLLRKNEEQVKDIGNLSTKLNYLSSEILALEKSLENERNFQKNLIDAITALNWS